MEVGVLPETLLVVQFGIATPARDVCPQCVSEAQVAEPVACPPSGRYSGGMPSLNIRRSCWQFRRIVVVVH